VHSFDSSHCSGDSLGHLWKSSGQTTIATLTAIWGMDNGWRIGGMGLVGWVDLLNWGTITLSLLLYWSSQVAFECFACWLRPLLLLLPCEISARQGLTTADDCVGALNKINTNYIQCNQLILKTYKWMDWIGRLENCGTKRF